MLDSSIRVGIIFAVCSMSFAYSAPVRRNYADIQAELRQISAQFPSQAKLISLGNNDQGIAIEGLEIGAANGTPALLVATHHGNEYGSTEVARALAHSLAETPLTGVRVTVIPVLNVSGYNRGSREETLGSRTVDPNRDYPNPCKASSEHVLRSTRLLAEYVDREHVVSSATLHTYHPAVVYPWGFAADNLTTPYDNLFIDLGRASTVESGYTVGNSAQVIYPATGTFEDYAFWRRGTWSLLFELGRTHSPSAAQIAEMVRVNVPGIRRFFAQAPSQAAEHHEFTAQCDYSRADLDRHDE